MLEPPSRRALLLLAAVAGLVSGTAACTAGRSGTTSARASAGAEQLAVRRTIAEATRLHDAALSLSQRYSAGTASRTLYAGIAADHVAHLTALGAPASTPSPSPSPLGSPSGSASGPASAAAPGSPSPSAPASTGTSPVPESPAGQLDAEWAAAEGALRLGLDVQAGGLSQLLVRIAASRAAHADLIATALGRDLPGALGPAAAITPTGTAAPSTSPPAPTGSGTPTDSGSPTGSSSPDSSSPTGSTAPTTTTPSPAVSSSAAPAPGSVLASPTDRALNRLLAGEHAAVYAYPVVIARTSGAGRKQAQALWAQHRYERDVLVDRLLGAGIEPEASLAAYRISPIPGSAKQAAQLAAKLERGLAALAADVVAGAEPGTDRILGADQLVLAGRRTASWAGRSDALPGGTAPEVSATASSPAASSPPASTPTRAPTAPR